MNVYDFEATNPDGTTTSLRDFEGKVLLVVNTATGCGFTPQYEKLEQLYADHRGDGFEILDFPCNQFANQAPEDDQEIHAFCTMKFGTEFPQFKKGDVNGDNANPLFAYLASEKPHTGFSGLKGIAMRKVAKSVDREFGSKAYIKWNFTKFLIDRNGNVVERFEPTVSMDEVRAAVEAQL